MSLQPRSEPDPSGPHPAVVLAVVGAVAIVLAVLVWLVWVAR